MTKIAEYKILLENTTIELIKIFSNDPRLRIRAKSLPWLCIMIGLYDLDLLLNHLNPGQAAPITKNVPWLLVYVASMIKMKNRYRLFSPFCKRLRTVLELPLIRRQSPLKHYEKGWVMVGVSPYVYHPLVGKPCFEKLVIEPNPDIRWIVKENLKKKRLERVDSDWVKNLQQAVGG